MHQLKKFIPVVFALYVLIAYNAQNGWVLDKGNGVLFATKGYCEKARKKQPRVQGIRYECVTRQDAR